MGYFKLALVIIAWYSLLQAHADTNDATIEDRFRSRLLHLGPGAMVRPVANKTQPINVTIAFDIKAIKDFENYILHLHGYLYMSWVDNFRQWDADNEGVDSVRVRSGNLWTPDIRGYNTISEDVSNTLMVLSPSGLINYVRPSTLAIPCSRTGGGFTSVHSYRCILKLGSWTYNEDLIKLIIKEQDTSRIWSLPDLDIGPISTTQYSEEFDCCPQAYSVYQLSLSVTN